RITALPGSIPEGDIVVLAKAGTSVIQRLAAGIEQVDALLRRWSVAGLSLIIVAVLLGALMYRA
ncbi:hypothetical protein AB4156_45100, partial [Cupriavidus sp. 2MCAB6]